MVALSLLLQPLHTGVQAATSTDALTARVNAAKVAVRKMLDNDMEGDASERMILATKPAVLNVPLCNQMFPGKGWAAYLLGDGGMQIATSWRFKDRGDACSNAACTIGVIYRTVGTTKGCGSPSWKSDEEWTVVPLPQAVEKQVQYTLWTTDGRWKIRQLPPPYVSKDTMRAFFVKEIRAMTKVKLASSSNEDSRATKNTQAILAWDQQQLDLIEKLSN
jgi:hypothetical protein